jgi:DNA-binding transcriptional LysR family regulator
VLEITSLWQDPFALVSPVTNPYAVNVADLSGAPFISYNRGYAPFYHQQFIACCNRIGFTPQVVHECNNIHSILRLVESGLGVAFVPSSIKNQYPYLSLQFTELDNIQIHTEIVMAHHRQTRHPALTSFKELGYLFQ